MTINELENLYKDIYTSLYDDNEDHAETALFNTHAHTEEELKQAIKKFVTDFINKGWISGLNELIQLLDKPKTVAELSWITENI